MAPFAIRVPVWPGQIALEPEILNTGKGLTFTAVRVLVPRQPAVVVKANE